MTHRFALPALGSALLLAPVACSPGGGSTGNAAPTPSHGSAQSELAASRRFAQCARTNGHPAFPDPIVDGQNRVTFPETAAGASADRKTGASADRKSEIQVLEKVQECKAIMTEMMALRPPDPKRDARPSAAILQKLRRFAQCVRDHGTPNWPDPASDGSFPITGTSLGEPKRSPAIRHAFDACTRYREGVQDFGGFS
jgi:hypothetical protein